jgi:Do/DeqQ family serine protease
MKWKQLFLIIAVSAFSAVGGVWTYNKFMANGSSDADRIGTTSNGLPANYAGFIDGKTGAPAEGVDLTKAANAAVPAVVHIKTKIAARKQTNDLPRQRSIFDDFFNDFPGYGPNMIPEQRASGSGVLVSEDGYIVTNNHVVSNGSGGVAEEINVTLNDRKTYKARLVGRDPSSDLAVLKIDGSKFPFLLFGNSANLQLGQWVLAIGYPLGLETTVTAGIVSATGRSININRRQSDAPIESFIQTDAAVNQGNSGGALVSTNGELIGINSAILAPSGTYAGYSFAIPVNLVKKIVDDIVRFGEVQRGYLGISYAPTEEMSEEEQKEYGIPTNTEGVYVSDVSSDGGAYASGIKKGDVITKVNNIQVITGLQMSAQIASFRPGDKVPVTFIRNGKEVTTTVTLKKKAGTFESTAAASVGSTLGAELANLESAQAKRYGLDGGVLVRKIRPGGLISRQSRMNDGFVITTINGQPVKTTQDLSTHLSKATGRVKLEGVYLGYDSTWTYVLNLDNDND